MDINKVNEMFEDGTLSELFKAGFVSSKVFEYRQYFLFVDAQVRTRGLSTKKAALEAEIKFKKGRTTIYRALTFFRV